MMPSLNGPPDPKKGMSLERWIAVTVVTLTAIGLAQHHYAFERIKSSLDNIAGPTVCERHVEARHVISTIEKTPRKID